jgi:hypothetical protein
MAPPLQTYNSVLNRTVQNLEQAQGIHLNHATMSEIFRADDSEQADVISLPSTSDESDNTPPPSDSSASADDVPPPSNGLATANLIADLNCSTACLRNLRVRNSILSADLARANTSLTRREDKTASILLIESRKRVKWMATAAFTFALWVVYLLWYWYMRVEFQYIRKRRAATFGI